MSASHVRQTPQVGGPRSTRQRLGVLLWPGLATLVALAILLGLGVWQVGRKGWKEGVIAQIEVRARGEPGAVLPEAEWPNWRADADEFRRVRVSGRFLESGDVPLHGLMSGARGSPLQGFYLFTAFRLASGGAVMVNRGFVPTELGAPGRRPPALAGDVTLTGLVRAPEERGPFMPNNDPARDEWFARDIGAMAVAGGLDRAAPFWIDVEAAPGATGWPRPGQTRLDVPNNHLAYAMTWFGLAGTLVGVFTVWAARRVAAEAR